MIQDLQQAVDTLDKAKQAIDNIIKQGGYTINDMRGIRKLLLATVRNNIDPYALGHAPEKRHY